MKPSFGLIGYPLHHSLSPKLFQEAWGNRYTYSLYPIEKISNIRTFLRQHYHLSGINVTIPYKERIIDYLDDLDEAAQQIGAVNVVRIVRNEDNLNLKGFNTDYLGFQNSLLEFHPKPIKSALILGTGGAGKAVAYALQQEGISFMYVSRRQGAGCLTYDKLTTELLAEHKLIINTTPLGMSPWEECKPSLPYTAISEGHYLFDLIYNPEETLFLKIGKEQGAHTCNGYDMLRYQAEASWKIWGLW